MKLKDKVYVVDWGKHYSDITKWCNEANERVNVFPIKTKIPDYSGIEFHWKYNYETNYTKKGTVNKREPKKLVSKEPIYKHYKWEVVEVFKHPKAGQYWYTEEERTVKNWPDCKYTEEDLLLLASTHTDTDCLKCYIIITESGVSKLTPEQFAKEEFNSFIEANLRKWDRNKLTTPEAKKEVPKEIQSVFYDEDDNVLFGSSMTKGLVSYHYLEPKFSIDNLPIYLFASVSYDGKGNKGIKDKSLIKHIDYIRDYLEQK